MSLYRLVEIALGEVGVREFGGNNNGDRIREYQAATWLKPASWPWCAAFCCWVLQQWVQEVGKPRGWRCLDASAFGWEKWARKQGLLVLLETEKAKAGDFVIFDFSHIGIVVADQYTDFVETVEGNTNGKGERDSKSGDGVWRKTRHKSLVKCFIRLEAS